MSLKATACSVGDTLRTDVVVDGRFRLATDEPMTVGGGDTAPAPHELVPAALAACASTTLQMYAQRKGWDLRQVVVDVDYDQRARPPRCDVSIRVGGDLSAAQIAQLARVAAACPVQQALQQGIVVDEQLELAGELEACA